MPVFGAQTTLRLIVRDTSVLHFQAGARPDSQPSAPGRVPQPMVLLYCASYWLKASQFHSGRVQTRNQTSAGAKRPKEVQEPAQGEKRGGGGGNGGPPPGVDPRFGRSSSVGLASIARRKLRPGLQRWPGAIRRQQYLKEKISRRYRRASRSLAGRLVRNIAPVQSPAGPALKEVRI